MNVVAFAFAAGLFLAACLAADAAPTPAPFVRGVDLSMLQHLQDRGVEYREGGEVRDPLALFRAHGVDTVRLRLFVSPDGKEGQINTLPYTLKLARRVKRAHLRLLLDFHYSDGWADPTHQTIPAEWKDLSRPQLASRVFSYTRDVMAAFRQEGCLPDMVQVGNEVTNGMMWPAAGPLSEASGWNGVSSRMAFPSRGAAAQTAWDALAVLLKASIRGVRAADPDGRVKVMIHIDKGGNRNVSRLFFGALARRDVRFDVIGLSYYPFWHGTLPELKDNIAFLFKTYHKDVMVAETGYDWNGGEQGTLPFPPTPAGQEAFLRALLQAVSTTPGGRGVFYWAPEWVMGQKWAGPDWSRTWENRALFDTSGEMLPGLRAFDLNAPAPPVSGGRLPTRWSKLVSPTDPLPDYPRPQMTRARWQSLNGPWDYGLTGSAATAPPAAYDGKILVPFPYESALSGVGRDSPTDRRLWYRRMFTVPAAWRGQRVLMHFGAVNWDSSFALNGKRLGTHRGGYTAIDFDVTDALQPGANALVVSAYNPMTDGTADAQVVGKQRAHPVSVLYTGATGIWQSVWLEPVPAAHIAALKITPDVDAGALRLLVSADGGPAAVRVTVTDGARTVVAAGRAGAEIVLPIPSPRLWSPSAPHLYGLRVVLSGGDAAGSYFAMRKVSLGRDASGRVRILLNNRFVFQVGALDQGYWPDGIYTAPTDAALRSDIDAAKGFGFNLLRKHAKVEPDRWYYWADKLGILVWQDMPQAFGDGDKFSEATKAQWLAEWRSEVAQFYNHPSIIVWTLFNEGWGQHDTAAITVLTRRLDPTRLINSASGGYNQVVGGKLSQDRLPTPPGLGDINDTHTYPDPTTEKQDPARALACGEFGGVSLRVPGHVWEAGNFGYGAVLRDGWHLTQRYQQLLKEAYGLRDAGASAVVYTQIADVERETNGLMTYDRAVVKPLPLFIRAANAGRFPALPPAPPAPVSHDLVPTSEDSPKTWSYTTTRPVGDWTKPGFDDAAWKTGPAPFGQGYDGVRTA